MLIYQYAFALSGASNYNSASALGVILMLVLAVFSGGFLWATRERRLGGTEMAVTGSELPGSSAPPRRLGAGRRPVDQDLDIQRRSCNRRARQDRSYRIVLTLVIVVFTLVFIGPLYFLFTDGLKSTQEVIATPPTLYPHHVYPSNYVQAWNRLDMARMLWNTVYYAFGALAFQLVFDVAAAYSLSKLRPFLGNAVLFLMLATLMIPATVLVVPQYVTVADLPILHWNLIGTPGGDLAAVGRQRVQHLPAQAVLRLDPDRLHRRRADRRRVPAADPVADRAADVPADHRRRLDLRPGRGVEGLPLAAAG